VILSESMTRSGEKSSPKRDEVGRSLFHTRSGKVIVA